MNALNAKNQCWSHYNNYVHCNTTHCPWWMGNRARQQEINKDSALASVYSSSRTQLGLTAISKLNYTENGIMRALSHKMLAIQRVFGASSPGDTTGRFPVCPYDDWRFHLFSCWRATSAPKSNNLNVTQGNCARNNANHPLFFFHSLTTCPINSSNRMPLRIFLTECTNTKWIYGLVGTSVSQTYFDFIFVSGSGFYNFTFVPFTAGSSAIPLILLYFYHR